MMSSSINVEEAEDWHYRGEGAANVVLAYHGSDPALIGKVLRLGKLVGKVGALSHIRNGTHVLSAEERILWADYPSMVSATTTAELNHVYARDVLRALLGDENVDPGTLVHLSSSFLESLNQRIAHKRPAWRAQSGSLTTFSGTGLLISDHTCFSKPEGSRADSPLPLTISVEIKVYWKHRSGQVISSDHAVPIGAIVVHQFRTRRVSLRRFLNQNLNGYHQFWSQPKCGFLPTSEVRKENVIKKSVSRFTMHQALKLVQGKIKQISKYSPLDLFSGSKEGILKAIKSLFETPQNNLRIFVNGNEIFGDSIGSSNNKTQPVAHLEEVLERFIPNQVTGRVESFQQLIADLLFNSDVLRNLLAVQKLDTLDIEGAFQAYEMFQHYLKNSSHTASTEENLFNKPVTTKNVSPLQQTGLHCSDPREDKLKRSFEDCRKILCNFLISATAKDCGLMLTLQQLASQHTDEDLPQALNASTCSDQQYLHKILLLDLDVKQVKKMPHYFKLDQEIVRVFTSSNFLESSFSPLPKTLS